jgi:transposase-like protein
MPGRPPRYTPEFKDQVVKEVIDGKKSVSQVAREFNISSKTIGPWVTAYRKRLAGRPIPEDIPDNERMKELERRNRELEQENAFLKKCAAYFAKEQR